MLIPVSMSWPYEYTMYFTLEELFDQMTAHILREALIDMNIIWIPSLSNAIKELRIEDATTYEIRLLIYLPNKYGIFIIYLFQLFINFTWICVNTSCVINQCFRIQNYAIIQENYCLIVKDLSSPILLSKFIFQQNKIIPFSWFFLCSFSILAQILNWFSYFFHFA